MTTTRPARILATEPADLYPKRRGRMCPQSRTESAFSAAPRSEGHDELTTAATVIDMQASE
jgi:hypothetical protein